MDIYRILCHKVLPGMGSIISRFRRKKTTVQVLEDLEEEIEETENCRQNAILKQKRYVGKLIVYSILIYILCVLTFYFLYFPSNLKESMISFGLLVLIPVAVFMSKRALTFYFEREMSKNKDKLADLRAKKKKILEEVMDKETFRVAQEILEKFAPDQLRKSSTADGERKSLIKSEVKQKEKECKPVIQEGIESMKSLPERSEINQLTGKEIVPLGRPHELPRRVYQVPSSSGLLLETPVPPPYQLLSSPIKRPYIRPVVGLKDSRNILERLIEHFVGDGPSNRYALICTNCSVHNGMALKEEFEYMSYRCINCGFPNPAKKTKARHSIQNVESISGCIERNQSEEEKSDEEGEVNIERDKGEEQQYPSEGAEEWGTLEEEVQETSSDTEIKADTTVVPDEDINNPVEKTESSEK